MKPTHTLFPVHYSRHATPEHSPQFGIYAEGQSHDFAIVKGPEEIAAFLVRAANNHEALLAALEKIKANSAESPEWIYRVATEAISAATEQPKP